MMMKLLEFWMGLGNVWLARVVRRSGSKPQTPKDTEVTISRVSEFILPFLKY